MLLRNDPDCVLVITFDTQLISGIEVELLEQPFPS